MPPPIEAPHAEYTRGADGREYWNLTCFCGKRLLAPATGPHKQGRCPQCGVRLLFPLRERHSTTGPLPIVPMRREVPKNFQNPAAAVSAPVDGARRHDSTARLKPGHSAADTAAEKLRPKRGLSARSAGLVSAWPAAETGPRLLAAFVDLTVTAAALALWLALSALLHSRRATASGMSILGVLIFAFNDGVLQLTGRGSLGKRLTVLVLKDASGAELSRAKALLRPLLKLLLWPGMALCFFDENKRALHDRLLGTRVLKGRPQR